MHYAAALQGTTNGLNNLYTILVENGADENVVDVVMNALYLSIMIQQLFRLEILSLWKQEDLGFKERIFKITFLEK